jgi:hypothetical protein
MFKAEIKWHLLPVVVNYTTFVNLPVVQIIEIVSRLR